MIWHYFPIGMRFPVPDFSDETRRACWKIALSAVYASDPCGTGLYEACESFDPISQSPVYTCIVCYVGIKQSRAAGKTLHSLDALLTRLCFADPLVQANYLESFGPYPILAEIDAEGKIRPNENGAAFLPTGPIEPMRAADGWTVLIAPTTLDGVCDAETLSRTLGTAAAEQGFRVRRMLAADGGAGTVRALISGTHGRYETVLCENMNGERTKMTVGVIPGHIAVLESEDAVGRSLLSEKTPPPSERSSACVGELIRKTLDLGFRKIWIGLGESPVADLGLGALYALGVRFCDADGQEVVPCNASVQRIAKIDRSGLDPRLQATELVALCASRATLPEETAVSALGGDIHAPGSGAAGGLGFALSLIGGTPVCGADRIMERIGLGSAVRESDFVITAGKGPGADGSFCDATEAVLERLSEGSRSGCLLVADAEADTEAILRAHPELKGVAVCPPKDEPYAEAVVRAFSGTVLPMIGKGVVNDRES